MKKQVRKVSARTRRGESGFTLIEVLVAAAIVTILLSAFSLIAMRAIKSGNETSALSSVKSISDMQAAYQKQWGGFSPNASSLGGAENAATTATTWTADQEMTSTEALAIDTGLVRSGYTLLYHNSGAVFAGNGAATGVYTNFEITAIPLSNNQGTRSFCVDSSGTYYRADAAGTPASGAGCVTDFGVAAGGPGFPLGQ